MKKALIILFIVLLLRIIAFADYPKTAEEAVNKANEEIGYMFYDINLVNKTIWNDYYVLVYGTPHGNKRGSEYRYLGITPEGTKFANPKYPDDDPASTVINNWNWVDPVEERIIDFSGVFDLNQDYEPLIREALENKYGYLFNENDTREWYKIAHILQPPTKYTPGVGRLWHLWDKDKDGVKETWYITFVIPAEIQQPDEAPIIETPDLYVKSIEPSTTVTEPGKTYNATVTYGLKDYTETVKAKLGLTHNGYSVSGIDGQEIKFQPWEEKTLEFTFTGQKDKSSIIEAKIWPVSLTDDKNWNNNSKKVIMPLKEKIDLSVKMAYAPEFIDYGEKNSLEADIRSNSKNNIETKVIWRVNGKIVKKYTVTIRPNKTLSNGIDYTPPSSAKDGDTYTISVEVNPDHNQPANESTWSNNKSQTKVEVFKDEREDSGLGPSIIIE